MTEKKKPAKKKAFSGGFFLPLKESFPALGHLQERGKTAAKGVFSAAKSHFL